MHVERCVYYDLPVAPVRERGLKLLVYTIPYRVAAVAPVRERGLKSLALGTTERFAKSLP